MELRVNGHVFAIGQMGHNFLILDDPMDHPTAAAEIFLSIDGHVSQWWVGLPNGIVAGNRKTGITSPSQS